MIRFVAGIVIGVLGMAWLTGKAVERGIIVPAEPVNKKGTTT